MIIPNFEILFAHLFEPEREIEDVDYVDVTDEVEVQSASEPKLLEYNEDDSRPNQ